MFFLNRGEIIMTGTETEIEDVTDQATAEEMTDILSTTIDEEDEIGSKDVLYRQNFAL